MVEENFAEAPTSIGEARAKVQDDCRQLTPRELLVSLLRRIDRGEIDPQIMTVVYEINDPALGSLCASRHAGGRLYERVGLLQASIQDLLTHSLKA